MPSFHACLDKKTDTTLTSKYTRCLIRVMLKNLGFRPTEAGQHTSLKHRNSKRWDKKKWKLKPEKSKLAMS